MVNVEVLYFRDCPGHVPALALLKDVIQAEGIEAQISEIEIPGAEAVEKHRFVGSPTIRIDDVDLEGSEVEEDQGYGWRCRYYASSEPGQTKAVPSADLIRRRLREAARAGS